MRWMLPLGVLALALSMSLPAEAGDDDKAKIAALEAENAKLRHAFDQLSASSERSVTALARLGEQFTAMRAEYEKLRAHAQELVTDTKRRSAREEAFRFEVEDKLRQVRERMEAAELRAARLVDALGRAETRATYLTNQIRKERADRSAYYRMLFRFVGKPAAKPLVDVLLDDPETHATRITTILASMGADAQDALPSLEKLATDPEHAEGATGAAARSAVAAIRKALAKATPK